MHEAPGLAVDINAMTLSIEIRCEMCVRSSCWRGRSQIACCSILLPCGVHVDLLWLIYLRDVRLMRNLFFRGDPLLLFHRACSWSPTNAYKQADALPCFPASITDTLRCFTVACRRLPLHVMSDCEIEFLLFDLGGVLIELEGVALLMSRRHPSQ